MEVRARGNGLFQDPLGACVRGFRYPSCASAHYELLFFRDLSRFDKPGRVGGVQERPVFRSFVRFVASVAYRSNSLSPSPLNPSEGWGQAAPARRFSLIHSLVQPLVYPSSYLSSPISLSTDNGTIPARREENHLQTTTINNTSGRCKFPVTNVNHSK